MKEFGHTEKVQEVVGLFQITIMVKKYHYSSLVSKWDSHSDKGEAPAGETSEAWIWTKFGQQVPFYYDYD